MNFLNLEKDKEFFGSESSFLPNQEKLVLSFLTYELLNKIITTFRLFAKFFHVTPDQLVEAKKLDLFDSLRKRFESSFVGPCLQAPFCEMFVELLMQNITSFAGNQAEALSSFASINCIILLFSINQICAIICDSIAQNRVRTVLKDLVKTINIYDSSSSSEPRDFTHSI